MGNFYVNVTVKGPDQAQIVQYLGQGGCDAYVSPCLDAVTTICEAETDKQDESRIKAFASDLSKHFACPALAVLNHDDDVLAYWFYEDGTLGHDYNSDPEYFSDDAFLGLDDGDDDQDDDAASTPAGGDTQTLCRAFGNPGDPAAVERALRQTYQDNPDLIFALERHAALLRALGLPELAVCCGFKYLDRDEFPPGLASKDFVRV